jgi:hypothetical protein
VEIECRTVAALPGFAAVLEGECRRLREHVEVSENDAGSLLI